ncbi:MAG: T9SS type A sorting domain-containing protein [Ignavibacteriaceae bacterium]|nr:T9SS type A sorting domain-containing protein [Ignavibacteriaceae bacterium]
MSIKSFNLETNQTKEIMMAYIVGTGSDAISSVTSAKSLSDAIQDFYEDNFGYPIILSTDEHVAELGDFKLEQNYPNPFNPSTKISWQSPVSSWQTLKVYDMLGREVATLVDEYRPAGSYEVEFSAKSGLKSGVYFYTLRAGEFVQTKKMILIK